MSNSKKALNKDSSEATAMDEPLFEELQVGEGPSPEPNRQEAVSDWPLDDQGNEPTSRRALLRARNIANANKYI